MKTLSNLLESFDGNPGNGLGVTNHLTPIFNIITTVRNIFGLRLGVIVEEGEDHVSIKLHSSKFTSPKEVNKVLDEYFNNQVNVGQGYNMTTLRNYITSQGLTEVKMVNLGLYYVVYFSPNDIRTAENPDVMASKDKAATAATPCKEMLNMNLSECELDTILLEELDDEELEDKSLEELFTLIDSTNKIKAAEKLATIIADEIELPKEYYFKAVKDADGNESIALRHKMTKRRPFGKTADIAVSLMNIYKTGDEAVWVGAFDDDSNIKDEERTLIENILKMLHAKETDDKCVYSINGTEENNNAEDKKEDSTDDKKEEETKVDLTDYKSENSVEDSKDEDNKNEE